MSDTDGRVQMNVRVPRTIRDTVDARRQPLGLSRDAWVTRAITHALTVVPRTPAVPTGPTQRTVPRPRHWINRVEFYSHDEQWHWRFVAVETGETLSTSPAFRSLDDARRASHRVLLANQTTPVEFLTLIAAP